MALKGFLASGFQKLIGASRIKGANDRFLGEHNTQNYTGDFPITAALNDGFNVIRYTGTANRTYSTGTLFSTTPTAPTQVVLRNTTVYKLTLSNVFVTGGALLTDDGMELFAGESVTLVYDTTSGYWRDEARSDASASLETVNVTNTNTAIVMGVTNRRQIIKITTNTSSDRTLTALVYSSGGTALPVGMEVTIWGAPDLTLTYQLLMQQHTGTVDANSYEKFLINGDFVITRNSTITLKSTGVGWIEIGRSTPTYGA